MSLQGSLETFALPDVLGLLASTKKSGELRVTAGELVGSVWMAAGELVQSSIGGRRTAATDAVFQLLRLGSGSFSFVADAVPSEPGRPEPVGVVLASAQTALAEWRDVVAVVPDLDVVVAMAAEAPGAQVTVAADQWKVLAAVAGRRPVREVMAALGLSELETGKAVKGLVDARLATVEPAPDTRRTARPASTRTMAAEAPAPGRPLASPARTGHDPGARSGTDPGGAPGSGDVAGRPRPGWQGSGPAKPVTVPERPRRQPGTDPRQKAGAASSTDAQALVAQLAALAGDDEEVVAEKVAAHLAEGGELPPVADANEPINRGLLLKFLSSVRN